MAPGLTRRRFLQYSAAGGCLLVPFAGCRRSHDAEPAKPIFLTPAELLTATAACERILPRDEDPGAIDLGVPNYIDRALAAEPVRFGERFRKGLHALDEESRRRAGKAFHQASAATQDNIIDDWQEGEGEQAGFVKLLTQLTLEGAFGDPSYGGNRDGRGWRLIGFEPCEPRAHHRSG